MNNKSALDYMMSNPVLTGFELEKPDGGWSLSLLAEMLMVGPPRLQSIINCLKDTGSKDFVDLVNMLLPEYKDEIMSSPKNKRVYSFCFYFGKKYYPLPANMDCPPSAWTEGMPIVLMGLSYGAYHDLDLRPGYLLLLSLVVYPYEGDGRDLQDDSIPFNPDIYGEKKGKWKPEASDIQWLKDLFTSLKVGDHWIAPMGFQMIKISSNEFKLTDAADIPEVKTTIARTLEIAAKLGIKATFKPGKTSEEKMATSRIPLLDKVQSIVGRETIRKIPKNGWYPQDLHKMTDGTRFEGVGEFADWACAQTNCVLLDTCHDNCEYVEGNMEPVFKWTKRNVGILTEQWPKVVEIRAKIDHIVEWLEQDQANHFVELVNFLMSCKLKPTKKEDAHLKDEEDRFCYLDMAGDEDDMEDENEN
jgi:hypothetical protein